jgi:hypothetical protein
MCGLHVRQMGASAEPLPVHSLTVSWLGQHAAVDEQLSQLLCTMHHACWCGMQERLCCVTG